MTRRSRAFRALAKVSLPRLHRPILREHLFRELDDARELACVWLGATAGAGKTTLVGTWIDARRLPNVWLQLDEGDRDPTTFFHFLTLACGAFKHAATLPVAVPEVLADLTGFARQYFRMLYAKLPPGTVVVLDNLHEATSDSLFTILSEAVRAAPREVCVLVISRELPPASMVPAIATGQLKVFPPGILMLSRWEIGQLTAAAGVPEFLADVLHAETDGWASGITLMIEAVRASGESTAPKSRQRELVFEYFAAQVFSQLDATIQSVLLKTCVLPSMTSRLAAELSGHAEAASVLANLYERRLFIYCSTGTPVTYQYHRLFREFLLHRARLTFGDMDFRTLSCKAAILLEAAQAIDHALTLALEAENWALAACIIVRHAEVLASQSRWHVLLAWIDALPADELESWPWLIYWQGVAMSATRSRDALRVLERAVARFAAAHDADGQLLACSEGLNCAFRLWSFTELSDAFLATIQALLADDRTIGETTRLRALTGAVVGLTYRRPTDELLPIYAEEVAAALPRIRNREDAMRTALPVLEYFNDLGAFDRSEQIVAMVEALPGTCGPALRYQWWDQLTWQYCYTGERERATAAADRAFECAEADGLHDLLFLGRSMQCAAAIQFGDLDRAERLLRQVHVAFPPDMLMHSMRLHWLELWLMLARNDWDGARRTWRQFSAVPLAGVPIMYASSHPVIAVLLVLGEHQQALARVRAWREALTRFNSTYYEFNFLLMEAAALLAAGDAAAGHATLSEALKIGAYRSYLCTTTWVPPLMAQLCGVALEQDIEVGYVHRLIRHNRLTPAAAGALLWPRPVKVLTLGQFSVLHDDRPVEVGRKVPRKVFSLLKVILAHGGQDVRMDTVCDLVWPDLEGDAQHTAFSIAMHRLRKLLGDHAALRLLDGRIALDPDRVWVDAYALDTLLDRALTSGEPDRRGHAAEQALRAYRGPFLSGEPEPWAVSLRERIRSRFVRVLQEAGSVLENDGRHAEAIVFYQRGIETDCLAEELYQGLIRVYTELRRYADAKATFKQLEEVLHRMLHVPPSPISKALVARLPAS